MTENSNNVNFNPNNLFYFMLEKFANRDRSDKLTICNEGVVVAQNLGYFSFNRLPLLAHQKTTFNLHTS